MPVQTGSEQKALQPNDDTIPQLLANGWKHRAKKQLDAAADNCRLILEARPDNAEALHLLGLLKWEQGDCIKAVSCLQHAVTLEPHQPLHLNSLGVILNDMGHYSQAAEHLRKALQISPGYVDAQTNLGLALFNLGQLGHAAQLFQNIADLNPGHAPSLANLGMVRLAQGDFAQAVSAYGNALTVNPGRQHWLGNLGAAWIGLGQFQQAASCYTQALSYSPRNIDHCVGLGVALRSMGDLGDSIRILRHALTLAPGHENAIANLSVACQHTCLWRDLTGLHRQLDKITRARLQAGETPAEQPLFNIRRSDDLQLNLSVARAWSRHARHRALNCAKAFTHETRRHNGDSITVGYLSYDFRDHPVAQQLLPLFRLHDRNRFRVLAFSMGPDDGSLYRRLIEKESDAFIDIANADPVSSARTIFDHHVDILIDLMGHTHHHRMEVLALRPAPVQIGYLGFLGSTGASYIDYLIADEIVVPESHTGCYSEKIVWMPHCYQLNHRETIATARFFNRADWNLPDQGVVFSCFNKTYKIDAGLFDAWMDILSQVPHSVLWLYRDNHLAAEQLQSAAEERGIDRHRLVFADKVPLADHLKRLALADIALDTLAYNGGATTSHALQAGIPVLTVLGRHWVSRMAASHIYALDLSELVAQDLAQYKKKAIDLALSPFQLQSLKNKLKQKIYEMPLFNAELFIRHFEKGLCEAWRNYQCRRPPAHINVSALPPLKQRPDDA